METEKEKKEEKPGFPAHVQTFDAEKPLFETFHVCLYLSQLEDEKGKEESERTLLPSLHK